MALSIFETAFGKDRTAAPPPQGRGRRRFDYAKGYYVTSGEATRTKFNETAGRTLGAIQTVCDALIPPSAGRYTVVFGGATAMTERGRRRITVTPQPLYTKGMRLADVADTLTGFIVHEIGHVEISGETDRLLSAWLDHEPGYLPWRNSIHAISNVLDDHALEVWARGRFPGVAHTFRVTTKFVAQEQGMFTRPPFAFSADANFTDRFNFLVVATRYRWFVRWSSDPATKRERQWWIDWIERYGDPTDAALRVEGIKAAIARLAINPKNRPPEEEPPPPTTECGPGIKSEDEDEDEPETFDTDDESEDDDEDDDESEDESEDGDEDDDEPSRDKRDNRDPDESEDDEDDEGEDNDDDDPTDGEDNDDESESDEDDDEDDESESEPEDEPEDEPGPAGWDDDGTDLESKPEDNPTEDPTSDERPDADQLDADPDDLGREGEGGSNAPIYEGFDPERLTSDRIKTVDDYTEERETYDRYRDEQLQEQAEVEMRAERITDTHGHGSMKVVINL